MDGAPPYAHPRGRIGAKFATWLANDRFIRKLRRALLSRLPFAVLRSDVRDVVYLNWIVPTRLVAHLVPPSVRLVQWEASTVLTILVYRHGHFGPRWLGGLRRWFPSPLQCNWRLYVRDVHDVPVVCPTVYFIRNFFDSALYAIGTRLASDALPSELPSEFAYSAGASVHARIVDATGQLEFDLDAEASDIQQTGDSFSRILPEWNEAISMLTLQDTAIVQPADLDQLAQAGISLPIDCASVRPLRVTRFAPGEWLAQLGAVGTPFAFLVPAVQFEVLWERLLARPG